MWVTWKHEHTDFCRPLTFEEKVEIFYEETLGWQLHIADLIANGGKTFGEFKMGKEGYEVKPIRHSGFAVLHICLSYLELVGSLQTDKPQAPTKSFIAGIRFIPELMDLSNVSNRALSKLYDRARCGLYHEGRFRPGVGLGFPPDGKAMAYMYGSDMFGISPERLPPVLKNHLNGLKQQLLARANVALCSRFEARFDSGFTREAQAAPWWQRLTRWVRHRLARVAQP